MRSVEPLPERTFAPALPRSTSAPCEPTSAEVEVALAAFDYLDTIPLYGRADLVADASGTPCLIELELVEPDLFFEHNLASASLLADAIASRVSS